MEGHGIPYEERDNGKLFTLSGAASILEALLEEGRGGNHTFMLGCLVQDVSKVEGEAGGHQHRRKDSPEIRHEGAAHGASPGRTAVSR